MKMGEHMRAVRKSYGLTVPELSRISDVSTAAIYNAENDRFYSTIYTIIRLANALKISVDEYIGRTVPR